MVEKMTEDSTEDILKECPRFKSCNVNVCPLDVSSPQRIEFRSEEKCSVSKNLRLKIGQQYNLPNLGLTRAEFAARKRFEEMGQESKDEFVRNGSVALKNIKTRSFQSQT